jgi:uncharacterized protein DUF4126
VTVCQKIRDREDALANTRDACATQKSGCRLVCDFRNQQPIFPLVERLDVLSVALGLAALAGVNLYLTVLATGLAIHFHWITLAPQYQSLEVLGNPWIISIAGVLYLLEFFADKIPWVDSIWDAVHTVIRPIGGALLAIQVLGHPSPAFTVIVALLAGGTSLLAHTAKAATRLASNTSPEPLTNIGLSLGEDAAVLGGLTLVNLSPLLALIIFLIALGVFFYFARRILRSIKGKIGGTGKKLNESADRNVPVQ